MENLKTNCLFHFKKDNISLTTILFGLYTAIIPANQALNFSGNGTITKYVGFIIIGLLGVEVLLKRQKLYLNKTFTIVPLLIFALSSGLWSNNSQTSIHYWTSLASLVCFYIVCGSRKYNIKEITLIKWSAIIGSLIMAFYLISVKNSFYGRVFILTNDGRYADPNGIASNMIWGTILLVDQIFVKKVNGNRTLRNIMYASMLIVIIAGFIMTGSRGAMLSLCTGIIIYITKTLKTRHIHIGKLVVTLSIIVVVLIIIINSGIINSVMPIESINRLTIKSIVETGGTGRFKIWISLIDLFSFSPIQGIGLGMVPNSLISYFGYMCGAHNVYLGILVELGLIGFILFLFFLFYQIKVLIMISNPVLYGLFGSLLLVCFSLDFILDKGFWNIMIFIMIFGHQVCNSRNAEKDKTVI